jgi:hypothetical protein
VFDIDETLVLASETPFQEHPDLNTATIILSRSTPSQSGQPDTIPVFLCFRPYLLEMLIELYPDFELILFTVGSLEYAHAFNKALNSFYWKSKLARQDFF